MKREILRRLEAGHCSLAELVAATGRAKSTLSAIHLPPLVEGGLVEEVPVPTDQRTKRYRLRGERLGRSEVDAPRLKSAVLDFARRQGVSAAPSLDIVDPVGLLESGASRRYILAVAARLGDALAQELPTGPGRLDALGQILSQRRLGLLRRLEGHMELSCGPERVEFLTSLIRRALGEPEAAQVPLRVALPPFQK